MAGTLLSPKENAGAVAAAGLSPPNEKAGVAEGTTGST